jgi:hypothetical protein
MNPALISFCIVISMFMTGCDSSEIEKIRSNLGPFQYMGVDPQLSFNIVKFEAEAPDDAFSPEIKYTINIKQNNPDFPLNEYEVFVTADIVDRQGSKRDQIVAIGNVENGALSISNVETLYGVNVKDEAELKSLRMQIESYFWVPKYTHKPFQASKQ